MPIKRIDNPWTRQTRFYGEGILAIHPLFCTQRNNNPSSHLYVLRNKPKPTCFYTESGSAFQQLQRTFPHFMWIVGKFQTSSMGASLKFTFFKESGRLNDSKAELPPLPFYLNSIKKQLLAFCLNFFSSQQTAGGLCLLTVKYRISIIMLLLLHALFFFFFPEAAFVSGWKSLGSNLWCVHMLLLSTFNSICADRTQLRMYINNQLKLSSSLNRRWTTRVGI